MFSLSVRRAASIVPQTIISSLTSTASRTAASQALLYRSHQRRFSSSKPSSPADGSKGVAQGERVPTTPAQARPDDEKKPCFEGVAPTEESPTTQVQSRPEGEKKSSRAGKRKAKHVVANNTMKGRDRAMQNLPSVPSTQHIAPAQIYASSFFSLHRPISLHINFPKTVTDDAFAQIFTPRTKANKPPEVISTLSNTLENLDAATGGLKQLNIGNQQDQWNFETDEFRAAITAESYRKAEVQHLDSPPQDSAMNFSRHVLSGRYQPFSPPPAPMPMNTAESLAAGAEAAEAQEPQHRTYMAVLTIEESTDEHGEVTYMAHSSPLMQEDPPAVPTRFLKRMNIRQERYRERTEENGMWAISVKRQRKLKMKKHKYKKLMRRTRNLRRRLDRN